MKYDAIIIGAGNGGMTAATDLALHGFKTLLLEKHNLPGGCSSSFRRGRFEFETALHEMDGIGPEDRPGATRQFFQQLGLDLKLYPVADAYRTIVTGEKGYDITVPFGLREMADSIAAAVPGSRESLDRFLALAEECLAAIGYLSDPAMEMERLYADYPNFIQVCNQPVDAVLQAIGMPETARSMVLTYWSYEGMPGKVFDFLYFVLMLDSYFSNGAYIPAMKSHEFSVAFMDRYLKNGGELHCHEKVLSIQVKDGKVCGVRTDKGEYETDHVIANVIPHKVFGELIDPAEVPAAERQRENARGMGCSAVCVHIGLNKSAQELGIKDYSVFIADDPDSNRQFAQFSSMEHNGFQIMNCINVANPEASPEGTCILWSTQLVNGDAWENVKPEEYKRMKTEYAGRLIRQYEAVTGIRISEYIEEIEVATPVTFARYLNTPKGAIYGYQGQLWDNFLSRMMAQPEENYVEGLSFCGGHGYLLDGFGSAYTTGMEAAEALAAELQGGNA